MIELRLAFLAVPALHVALVAAAPMLELVIAAPQPLSVTMAQAAPRMDLVVVTPQALRAGLFPAISLPVSGSSVGSQSKTLTWSAGQLTRIDYTDGSYKLLSWLADVLQSVEHYRPGRTPSVSTFSYAGGSLVSVVVSA